MRSFEMGRIVATPRALDRFGVVTICALLDRYASGDWGDLDAHDLRENERALKAGTRIFSSYKTPSGKVWIVTEADRSSTTVLLPEEY